MTKTILTVAAGILLGSVGLALARQNHDHGPAGPTVKVLSAVKN